MRRLQHLDGLALRLSAYHFRPSRSFKAALSSSASASGILRSLGGRHSDDAGQRLDAG
jgi:hypothetical protein